MTAGGLVTAPLSSSSAQVGASLRHPCTSPRLLDRGVERIRLGRGLGARPLPPERSGCAPGARARRLPDRRRVVRSVWAGGVAAASGQPQRSADDGDRLRVPGLTPASPVRVTAPADSGFAVAERVAAPVGRHPADVPERRTAADPDGPGPRRCRSGRPARRHAAVVDVRRGGRQPLVGPARRADRRCRRHRLPRAGSSHLRHRRRGGRRTMAQGVAAGAACAAPQRGRKRVAAVLHGRAHRGSRRSPTAASRLLDPRLLRRRGPGGVPHRAPALPPGAGRPGRAAPRDAGHAPRRPAVRAGQGVG